MAKLGCERHVNGQRSLLSRLCGMANTPGAPLATSACTISRVGAPGTMSAAGFSLVGAGVASAVLIGLYDATQGLATSGLIIEERHGLRKDMLWSSARCAGLSACARPEAERNQ